jgi:protein gp37
MSATSKVEWTDSTINFWWGCTKVGPGCDRCYAETWDARFGGAHWGAGAPRKRITTAGDSLLGLHAQAFRFHQKHGRKRRVFIQSMSDFFDNEIEPSWRETAWRDIRRADGLEIQLLTKRIGNVTTMVGGLPWPRHVGLMITIVNQEEADRDIPKLLTRKAMLQVPWVGLSIEPMLGPIDLTRFFHAPVDFARGIDWIIVGGESGPGARPMHPDWARSIRDQCAAAGVAFFFKQWGEYVPLEDAERLIPRKPGDIGARFDTLMIGGLPGPSRYIPTVRLGKRRAGRLLDGVEHNAMPAART